MVSRTTRNISGKIEPDIFNNGQIQAGHIWKGISPLRKRLWQMAIVKTHLQRLMAKSHEMRYMQNGTYKGESFSEVFSRSPSNVSAYQS